MSQFTSESEMTTVDRHVGAQVRLRRKSLQMSQAALAAAIGLTFQQVQKYESGHNRISASKLYAIARTLGVSLTWFFEGYDGNEAEGDIESLELTRAFSRVRIASHRRRIVELVQALGDAAA